MNNGHGNGSGWERERSGDGWLAERRLAAAAELFPIEVRKLIAERVEHLAGMGRSPTAAEIAAAFKGIPRQDLAMLARIHTVYSYTRLAQIAAWGEARPQIREEREHEGHQRILEWIAAAGESEPAEPEYTKAARASSRERTERESDRGTAEAHTEAATKPRQSASRPRRRWFATGIAAGLVALLSVGFVGLVRDQQLIAELNKELGDVKQELDKTKAAAKAIRDMLYYVQDERVRNPEKWLTEIDKRTRVATEATERIDGKLPSEDP